LEDLAAVVFEATRELVRGKCQQPDWPGGPGPGIIVATRRPPEAAMTKRRDPSASQEDDGPKLISLQDKHDADRLLQRAYAAGEIDTEELKRRRGRVYAAVTPRELWKATGHRAGSRERADKADLWRSLRLQLAIVAFAAVIMVFVLLGTILNNQGGTRNTPVFPWEWGKDQPKDQPAQP
jgi:uncharacterized membrane protein